MNWCVAQLYKTCILICLFSIWTKDLRNPQTWSESSWSNLLHSFAWLCRCFLCVWQKRGQTLYLGLLFLAKTLMFLILSGHKSSESWFWFINLIVWTQRNSLELWPSFGEVHAQAFLLWIPLSSVQSVRRTVICTAGLFRGTGECRHLPLWGLAAVGSCVLHGVVGTAECGYANKVWWGALAVSPGTSPWLRNPSPTNIVWSSLFWSSVGTGWAHLETMAGHWPLWGVAVLSRLVRFWEMSPHAVSLNRIICSISSRTWQLPLSACFGNVWYLSII